MNRTLNSKWRPRGVSPPRSVLLMLAAATAAFGPLAGCDAFRAWDYPDFQAAESRLRLIDTLDLRAIPAADGNGASSAPAASQPASSPATSAPSGQPAETKLTLAECRALALAGNLDLKVELLNPTIAAQAITEAEAQFEAMFVADASYARMDPPGGGQGDSLSITPGLRIPFRTGGSVAVDVPVNRARSDDGLGEPNPSYASDLRLGISQPLLRGAGLRANTHAIRIARLEHQKSQALAKLEVIRVLAAVDRLYWAFYAARQELEVRRQELDLAQAQLRRAERQVAAQLKPDVEILRAQLGVAEKQEAIITAENVVRQRQRDLKRVLQKPGLEMDGPAEIVPATPPSVERFRLDAKALVELAMANRMELLELELGLAQDASTIDFQKNSTLPLAVLTYTYNVGGLGGRWDEAFDLMFQKRFEDHYVGVQVEIPLGNEAARSRLRRAIIAKVQRLATRQRRKTLIAQEVHDTIDVMEAAWQRILASRKRVDLARRVLEAEQRQFDAGLRTSTEVLDAQTRLGDAQSSEIRALTEYQSARVDLAVATGTLLGADRVRWEPIALPQPAAGR